MGYFSNGTEGELYQENWCDRCLHQPGCAVWLAHLLHNYDECSNKNSILHLLIPRSADKLSNEQCRMFLRASPSPEQGERASARLIAEAGTVYHETGLTPRQLAEQRGELVAALEGCLAQCVDRHDAEGSTQAQFMQIELARTALSRARTPATDREDS